MLKICLLGSTICLMTLPILVYLYLLTDKDKVKLTKILIPTAVGALMFTAGSNYYADDIRARADKELLNVESTELVVGRDIEAGVYNVEIDDNRGYLKIFNNMDKLFHQEFNYEGGSVEIEVKDKDIISTKGIKVIFNQKK